MTALTRGRGEREIRRSVQFSSKRDAARGKARVANLSAGLCQEALRLPMVDSITGVLSLKSRITMKEHRLMKATRQTFPAPAATRNQENEGAEDDEIGSASRQFAPRSSDRG